MKPSHACIFFVYFARSWCEKLFTPKFDKLILKKKRSADFLNKGYFVVEDS